MIAIRGSEDMLRQALEMVAVEIQRAGLELVVVADEVGGGLWPPLEVEGDEVRQFGGAAEEVSELVCLAWGRDVGFRGCDGELAELGTLGADLVELRLLVAFQGVELGGFGRAHAAADGEDFEGAAVVGDG